MQWHDAIVLGLVEGLTEYLPVSSTGHLILARSLLGLADGPGEREAADAFVICIQAGAILAVVGLYFARVRQMVRGVLGRDTDGLRLALNILAAFAPAAVIGLLLEDVIKDRLFGEGRLGLWPIVGAWFVGGAAILLVSWWRSGRDDRAHRDVHDGRTLGQLTWKLALLIGLAQCLALWPGVSRSLVTIVGGVLVGLSLPAAVEFSFLLGVVTLGAATCYDATRHGEAMVSSYGLVPLLVGFAVAALSAAIAVKWMVAYLNRHGLALFGYYRIGIAAIVAFMLWRGALAVGSESVARSTGAGDLRLTTTRPATAP